MTNEGLSRCYKAAFSAIGGTRNETVQWYLHGRPNLITRQSFFEQAMWAIWVAGMSSEGVRTFLAKAEHHGLRRGFCVTAAWTTSELREFMRLVHGRPVPSRAEAKWRAVHFLAKELAQYRSETEFREAYFAVKIRSRDLDESDIEALINRGLPFIGPANAHFIVRKIGGEAVKCDRYIEVFLRVARMTLKQLNVRLAALRIRPGLFDLVMWCYCERFVRNSKLLAPHVRRMAATS